MMLGCCSGPGFVVGYIGGLLLGQHHQQLLYAVRWRPTCWQRGFACRCLQRMHTG